MAVTEPEHRQVIVVGAGPAGSAAAQRLAEEGLDVLVLERRSIVGNPAQCGECIPNWGEVVGTFKHLDDHDWLKTYFEFPERLKLHRLDNMRASFHQANPIISDSTPSQAIVYNLMATSPTKPYVQAQRFVFRRL